MAGIANTWLRMNQRLAAFLMRKGGIPFARAAQDQLGRLGARAVGARVEFVPHAFAQFQACWILPQGYDPRHGALLYLHGGGYMAGSIEYAVGFGSVLAAATGCRVFAAGYRLAPEHRFPDGFEDCYAVAEALFGGKILPGLDPRRITVMGDSAGGNLAAAVCMKARDTGDFSPARQILIYPALYNCYTEDSPYESVRTNGTGYLLTSVKMEDYVKLYARTEEDRLDPYFAPLLAEDFSGLPDTLILTAEFDPLRDEGEDYGRKLREAGCRVRVERIEGALHGYFALGIQQFYVQESFRHINRFLSVEQALL